MYVVFDVIGFMSMIISLNDFIPSEFVSSAERRHILSGQIAMVLGMARIGFLYWGRLLVRLINDRPSQHLLVQVAVFLHLVLQE